MSLNERHPSSSSPLFARTWGTLLHEALVQGTAAAWFEYASFPKCILLAPVRSCRRFSRVQSRADLVNSRLVSWAENKSALWQGVLSRSQKSKSKPSLPSAPDITSRKE